MLEVMKAVAVKVAVVPYIRVVVRRDYAESCCMLTAVGSSPVASVWKPVEL